ncbi:cytochrome P450 [Streptomyces misionensis]|uniref:Cytochrome P450 n=1 Tax=Streptomyces misionensis TaxID=67331 RepID=A0A5C6K502_9ACTN|nr:cytochrome P450 [Streptomyces misionensis]TWV57404.1 cytochrome P450 [Streptomyces misionensis]
MSAFGEEIPGPSGRFLVGNTWDYERDRDGFLEACRRRYGDVFRFGQHTIVVSDPELIQQVLAETNSTYILAAKPDQDRDTAVHDTASWMQGRHRIGRGLGQALLAAHAQRLDQALQECFGALAAREFSVLETAQEISCRASAEFCLHEGAQAAAELTAAFNRLALVDMAGAQRWTRRLPTVFTPRRRRLATVERACLDLLGAQLQNRAAQQPAQEPRDLLDVMVDPRNGPPLDVKHGARMLKTILAAARGIPGTALAWIIRELGSNAELRAEVRAEADALEDAVATGLVHRLPFTHAAVQEILRVHPPVWLLGRVAAEPTQLAQWAVRPGERVLFSPHQLHHDPRWWREPEQLDPRRWLENERPYSHRCAYLPFGGGPRVCLGTRLGLLQLTLSAARLARDYDIELIAPDRRAPVHAVLRAPAGLHARLTPRAAATADPSTTTGTAAQDVPRSGRSGRGPGEEPAEGVAHGSPT